MSLDIQFNKFLFHVINREKTRNNRMKNPHQHKVSYYFHNLRNTTNNIKKIIIQKNLATGLAAGVEWSLDDEINKLAK